LARLSVSPKPLDPFCAGAELVQGRGAKPGAWYLGLIVGFHVHATVESRSGRGGAGSRGPIKQLAMLRL